jgi:pyrimidine-nucleoside phosphorylase
VELGAGRARKGDTIDHAVGIMVHRKVGDRVEQGEPLFTIHANDSDKADSAVIKTLSAYQWSDKPVKPLPLFYGVVA